MDDVFSLVSLPSSPPPLATPVPQRALGGEIQRIHLQLAADRAERLAESEARRPDYLVREKRPRSDADIPTLDELDAADATLGAAIKLGVVGAPRGGIGITVTWGKCAVEDSFVSDFISDLESGLSAFKK